MKSPNLVAGFSILLKWIEVNYVNKEIISKICKKLKEK